MNVAKVDVSGTSSRIGIHVGARLNLQLPSVDQSGFFANAAALLSLKGYEAGGHKVNPTYLEIPIHAGYLYRVSDDVAIFGDAGPYLAFGLMGKSNGVGVFSDTGLGWNNFDMGLGFRAGNGNGRNAGRRQQDHKEDPRLFHSHRQFPSSTIVDHLNSAPHSSASASGSVKAKFRCSSCCRV